MREKLEPLYGQVLRLTARFQSFGRTEDDRNVVCFERVMLNGVEVADHVWVHRSGAMKDANLQAGDMVCFEARVGRYLHQRDLWKRQPGDPMNYDYTLEKIKEFAVIQRQGGNREPATNTE